MPKPTVDQLLVDPDFLRMDKAGQNEILSEISQDFRGLSPDIQNQALNELSNVSGQSPAAPAIDAFLNEFPTGGIGRELSREEAALLSQERMAKKAIQAPSGRLTFEQESPIKSMVSQTARPILEYGGMLAGGIVGTPADIVTGPAGTVVGAGLGYSGGRAAANVLDALLGTPEGQRLLKRSTPETLKETGIDLLTGGSSEAGGTVIPKVIGMATKPIGNLLKQSIEKSVSQAIRPTTIENKAIVQKITPEILKRPRETFAFTQKGLQSKTEAQREAAGEAINAFGKLEGDINPKSVIEVLEKAKKPNIIDGKVIDKEAVARIEAMQENVAQFGDSISKEGLREFSRKLGKDIKAAKGFFGDIKVSEEVAIKKIADREMRDLISKDNPDLAKINKQFNFWANYNDVVSATTKRTIGQAGMPIAAGVVGAAMGEGPSDMATRALLFAGAVKMIRSPGWKLASAHTKNALSDNLINLAIPTKRNQLASKLLLGSSLQGLQDTEEAAKAFNIIE